ncbi:MAG: hypothetical protein ABI688_00210 [Bacteroidota bacterium]
MHVHHHAHSAPDADIHRGKKKWKHYFWEFFMLFLAVSLGFLVENMREQRIEHRREKAMMKALLLDLHSDQLQIDSLIQKRVTRNMHADSLISLLARGDKQSGTRQYLYGRNASRRIHFRPQDGTLLQLRNSGGFGVVHEQEVLNGINSYELGLKNNMENIEVEEKELSEYTALAAKVFNVSVFQEMTRNNTVDLPPGNPSLLTYDNNLLNELGIKLHYWKRTSLSVLESWNTLRRNGMILIGQIKTAYHFK